MSQSSYILFNIFSKLYSFVAESEISSNLLKWLVKSNSINFDNYYSLSGLTGKPIIYDISSQCLSFIPGFENTLTNGNYF